MNTVFWNLFVTAASLILNLTEYSNDVTNGEIFLLQVYNGLHNIIQISGKHYNVCIMLKFCPHNISCLLIYGNKAKIEKERRDGRKEEDKNQIRKKRNLEDIKF